MVRGDLMMTAVYMRVSKPPLCLPEAVADTVVELSRMVGVKEMTIYSSMSRDKAKGIEGRFVKVMIDDDDL